MALPDAEPAYLVDVAVVRPMTADDLRFAATLHRLALPHGFFARLGGGFLTAYYESFLASPHAVAYVSEGGHGPSGMLVGTVRNSAHYGWVLRRRWRRLAFRGAAALLARPDQLGVFLRTRAGWYARGLARVVRHRLAPPPPPRGDAGPRAVLTHVAVTPGSRRSGAGAALVRAFEDTARRVGCREAVLVTLAGRDGAGRFYRKLGWTLQATHTDHDGRLLECYQRRL